MMISASRSMPPPRIAYIVNDLAYFRDHRLALASAMREAGSDVLVAAGQADEDNLDDHDIKLVRLNMIKHRLAPVSDSRAIYQLRKTFERFQPDIVHSITMKPNLQASIALASRFGIRNAGPSLVMTFPGLGKVFEPGQGLTGQFRSRAVIEAFRFLNRRNHPYATTENQADATFLAEHGIAETGRVKAMKGTGLPLARFYTAQRQGNPTVLFAGRLIRGKGVSLYLDAAEKLKSQYPDVCFEIAGPIEPGNPDSINAALLTRAGQAGLVRYHGMIKPEAMGDLLRRCDIFCVPTLLREGFPRAIMEAMATGAAVIASDQPAIRQVITHGETGWLMPKVDADALAETIENALADIQSTRQLGDRAASAIRSMPVSEDDVNAAFDALYREILASRG